MIYRFNEFINERVSSENLVDLTWNDLVDQTSSSDNTPIKGRICIGMERKKFNTEYFPKNMQREYENFVEAYKAAGGNISEYQSNQGMFEIFCNYEGKNKAAQYILLSFCKLVFGPYVR